MLDIKNEVGWDNIKKTFQEIFAESQKADFDASNKEQQVNLFLDTLAKNSSKNIYNLFTELEVQILEQYLGTTLGGKLDNPSLFALDVSNNSILIGKDSDELYFYLTTNLTVDNITLYDNTEPSNNKVVAQMYDDGNYNNHGDDIAGDGVYSTKYFSTETQKSVKSFVAKSGANESNNIEINYYTIISDEDIALMRVVDEDIEEVINTDKYVNANDDLRIELIITKLNELVVGKKIVPNCIKISSSNVVCFRYVCGVLGGVMIGDFEKEFNGEASISNLTIEEKRDLWSAREQNSDISYATHEESQIPITPFNATPDDIGKMLILNAFPSYETEQEAIDARTKFYEEIKSEWDGRGLKTTLDTNVTVQDFKSFTNYDIIDIATHGSTVITDQNIPAICLTEVSTAEKDQLYSVELSSKQIMNVRGKYWILPSFFEGQYKSYELNNKFLFSESCMFQGRNGEVVTSMSDALLSRSAEAVVGVHNPVYGYYIREFMKAYVDQLLIAKTTQEAFNYATSTIGANHKIWTENGGGTYDDAVPIAYPILSGNNDARLVQEGISNGNFDSPIDILFSEMFGESWYFYGDVRLNIGLGDVGYPTNPNLFMALLTTGIGAKSNALIDNGTEGSLITQNFIVPNNATTLNFDYNFVSEEPMEFVGSRFNDAFIVKLKQGGELLFDKTYESINTSNWISVGGVDFSGGDDTAYQTGWKNASIDVSAYRGEIISIMFIVKDVGDEIFDSACLIDNVVLK